MYAPESVSEHNLMYSTSFDLPGHRTLIVVNDEQYAVNSADNANSYDTVHLLPSRVTDRYCANRGLTLQFSDGASQSCLIRFPGGDRFFRDSSLVVHKDRLYLSSGTIVCCVDLTSDLHLLWSTELLTGADNGLYICQSHNCILAVGDFDLTSLELDGSILWATNAGGVLTPRVSIDSDSITAYDDEGTPHSFSIETGTKRAG